MVDEEEDSTPRPRENQSVDSQDYLDVMSPEETENSKPSIKLELPDADPHRVWSRMLRQINGEKDRLRHKILLLERRKTVIEDSERRISQREINVECREHDLVIREAIVSAAEPFIPAARQLQDVGLDINLALPWAETIREKAQVEGISVDIAAIAVGEELRYYRHMGGLQRQIVGLQEQLKIVDTTISQKERLLSILAEFQNRGVDIERLGRELDKGQNQNPDLKQTPGQVNNNGFSKDLELINRVIELTS